MYKSIEDHMEEMENRLLNAISRLEKRVAALERVRETTVNREEGVVVKPGDIVYHYQHPNNPRVVLSLQAYMKLSKQGLPPPGWVPVLIDGRAVRDQRPKVYTTLDGKRVVEYNPDA